jgi:hypothetical protein
MFLLSELNCNTGMFGSKGRLKKNESKTNQQSKKDIKEIKAENIYTKGVSESCQVKYLLRA